MLDGRLQKHIDSLLKRYAQLETIEQDIVDAYLVMEECYSHDGKLLIAGNGGSAADCEHIVGELMKSFKIPRPVTSEYAARLESVNMEYGRELAKRLEVGLAAIPLA